MLTLEQFYEAYPDFKGSSNLAGHDGFVQVKLNEAALEIDPVTWGAKTNTGHGLLTAIKLAKSPYGKNAKMVPGQNGKTIYEDPYNRLVKQVAGKRRPIL